MRRARWKRKNVRDDLTLLCQITRNGGWLSRTSDQIRKSPTGCAILKSQISTSPHQKVRRIPVFQTGHSLPLFPLPLPRLLGGVVSSRALLPSSVPLGVVSKGGAEAPGLCVVSRGCGGEILFSKENFPFGFRIPNRYVSAGTPLAGAKNILQYYWISNSFAISFRLMVKILLTPCSCMVMPYSTSAASMVPRRWVITMNWVLSASVRI